MKAMILETISSLECNPSPLRLAEVPDPVPGDDELVIKVSCCGVCHTELDEIEGRTPPPNFPVILGHQIVGRVVGCGPGCKKYSVGDRIGIAWIYFACGTCMFTTSTEVCRMPI